MLVCNILYYEGDLFEISDGKEHYLFLSEHVETTHKDAQIMLPK